MHNLTFLYSIVSLFSGDRILESTPSSPTKIVQSIIANPTTTNDVVPGATNIIFQSKDGGQTWQDISYGLPENEEPEGFFAGESGVYLRAKDEMYRSKSNLKTPVWEKENDLFLQGTSIAFNRSGVMAYNFDGQIYQKMASVGIWSPMHTNFKGQSMRTIFETSDGSLFVGCDYGLYKSADRGRSWKQVLGGGYVVVTDLVESEGVLIGAGRNGILRSTDKGEHWEWAISEGGLGKVVERIDGGFAAISYAPKTESSRIRISLDSGKTWKAIDEGLPPALFILSIKQMGEYLICGHPDGIFRSSDMGKTWNMVHSGLDEKVFRIYVSGDIVYAVAGYPGC